MARIAHSPLVAVGTAILAGLFAVTTALATIHRDAGLARATRHFAAGRAEELRGGLTAAVEEYRAALALNRDHLEAERSLALTLLSLHRLDEAETWFGDLLTQRPTDGAINRGMARLMAARGRQSDARDYYQRAIYGQWPDEFVDARVDTRFELVDFLRRSGSTDDVLPELLRLKLDTRDADAVVQRRLASLLIEADAPEDAVDVLRRTAARAPRDVALLTHLAEAESAAGRNRDARATLRRAIALEPSRSDLRDRLTVIDRVLRLDPTLPRLGLVERTRRGHRILAAVVAHVAGCAAADETTVAPLRARALERAATRPAADAQMAEDDLQLAEQLWAAAPVCHDETPAAQALTQVLRAVTAAREQEPS
jgi:tetratricopeptide (TPR) repeat protein